MCPTGQKRIRRKIGDMGFVMLNQILREIKPYKTAVRFIRWGEPMCSAIFADAIRMTKNHGLLCHVNTNGSMVDERWMQFFINEKLDSIKFSFQGVTDRGYHEMRNSWQFNSLIEKVKTFYLMRTEQGSPTPFIQVGTTVTTELPETIQFFRDALEPFTDAVYVSKTMDLQEARQAKNYCQCPEVFDKLSIDWDGTVTACCGDYDNHMVVGCLRQQTLKEIWEGHELAHIRENLSNNRHDKFYLCARCARSTDNEVR